MRRQGASIFIYLIFGILIAIFVININPGQRGGREGGCTPQSNTVLTVGKSKVSKPAFLVAYSANEGSRTSRERSYGAIEAMIRRELLAQEAEDRGLRVTSDMVDEEIKKGFFFYAGQRVPLGEQIFDTHDDGTKTWNLSKFKMWVQRLNVSVTSYREEQARSMLAAMMAEILESSVRVSREEALSEYIYENTTVTYDLVSFTPALYRAAMKLTDADIARFLASHEEEVKAKFKADERTYKDVKPQLKLRQIFIAKSEPAAAPTPPDNAGSAAGSAAGSGSAAAAEKPADKTANKTADKAADKTADKKPADKTDKKAAGMPIEEAKAKLEAARQAITAGKKKFVDAAKELSTDEAMRNSGGDMGWRTTDNAQLGDKAVSDAVKTLKPGEMTPVITTDRGAYLVIAEDKRPAGDAKDLSYDQVKLEIAADLARDVWSKEAAKRAALEAIATVQKSNQPLDKTFERAPFEPGGPGQMSPEEQEQLMRQLREQMEKQQGGSSGSIEWESKDEPAAWKAADDTAKPAGGAGSATATGSASGSGSGKASGSASGSAAGKASGSATATASGSAAGSASGSASTATPAPTTTPATPAAGGPAEIVASKDQLPAFSDVPKPKLVKHGPTPRLPQLPGLSKDLTSVVFEQLEVGKVAPRVYESDGAYVLLQVTEKGQPKVEEFEKTADREIGQLRALRAKLFLEDWLKKKCEALAKDSKIKPDEGLLRQETDDKGNPLPSTYKPCMSFR
ncbi:MAG TPA: peptidylprolyl isomerase [Kofleriaceae bacterium]|nr:peptidylprolyl isomerase [Kofleriaceae bacterium]